MTCKPLVDLVGHLFPEDKSEIEVAGTEVHHKGMVVTRERLHPKFLRSVPLEVPTAAEVPVEMWQRAPVTIGR